MLKAFDKYKNIYMDGDGTDLVFSKNLGLSLDSKQTNCSTNVVIIGNGADVDAKYIEPNILQETGSKVIYDPNGELYQKYAPYLEKKGFKVSTLNLMGDMSKSAGYNPLDHVYEYDDSFKDGAVSSLKLSNLIDTILNYPDLMKQNETAFYATCIKRLIVTVAYLVLDDDSISKQDKTLYTIYKKIKTALEEIMRGTYVSDASLAGILLELERFFGTTEVVGTVLTMACNQLALFSTEEIKRVMGNDRPALDFDTLYKEPSYIFVCVPEGDHEIYSRITQMFYKQLYSRLYDAIQPWEKTVPINFYYKDFARIGMADDFELVIQTCRPYRIGNHVVFNSIEEAKSYESDEARGILFANAAAIIGFGPGCVDWADFGYGSTRPKNVSQSRIKSGECVIMHAGIGIPLVDKVTDLTDCPNYKEFEDFVTDNSLEEAR